MKLLEERIRRDGAARITDHPALRTFAGMGQRSWIRCAPDS